MQIAADRHWLCYWSKSQKPPIQNNVMLKSVKPHTLLPILKSLLHNPVHANTEPVDWCLKRPFPWPGRKGLISAWQSIVSLLVTLHPKREIPLVDLCTYFIFQTACPSGYSCPPGNTQNSAHVDLKSLRLELWCEDKAFQKQRIAFFYVAFYTNGPYKNKGVQFYIIYIQSFQKTESIHFIHTFFFSF